MTLYIQLNSVLYVTVCLIPMVKDSLSFDASFLYRAWSPGSAIKSQKCNECILHIHVHVHVHVLYMCGIGK